MKQNNKRGKIVQHKILAESNARPLVRKASMPIVRLQASHIVGVLYN